MTEPAVSVLVATRDRPEALRRCVESLLRCDYPTFEVIVVDQSTTASTAPDDSRVRIVGSPSTGKSRALNIARGLAIHRVLAFTDDDCTVPATWLKQGVERLHADPAVGLVFGALVPAAHDPEREFIPSFLPTERRVVRGSSHADVRGVSGANLFAHREVIESIGGLDERFGPGAPLLACEEYDLYYRALRAGFTVIHDPDTAVLHHGVRLHADGSGEALLRGYYFGEGAVLGKHVGSGDRTAIGLAARLFYLEVKWAVMGALKGRTKNVRRAASWARGFVRGLRAARVPSTAGETTTPRSNPPLRAGDHNLRRPEDIVGRLKHNAPEPQGEVGTRREKDADGAGDVGGVVA